MISQVLAKKGILITVCQPHTFEKLGGVSKWKCGRCGRGNIFVIRADHQGHKLLTKKCAVCSAKIQLTEVSR